MGSFRAIEHFHVNIDQRIAWNHPWNRYAGILQSFGFENVRIFEKEPNYNKRTVIEMIYIRKIITIKNCQIFILNNQIVISL